MSKNNNTTQPAADSVPKRQTLGQSLRLAREGKGLSILNVVDAIHLSEKQVVALEENIFPQLPEPAITRGFIRSYANFLEIDSAPLIEAYRTQVPNQEGSSIVVKANVNEVMSQQMQKPWLMYILSSILVLLFVVTWFYYIDSVDETSAPLNEDVLADVEVEAQTQAVVPEVAAPIESPIVANVESAPDSSKPVTSTEVSGQISAGEPANSQVDQNAIVDANAASMDDGKPLVFDFTQESWLSVKDATGSVVYEKLVPAGSHMSFDGVAPFKLVVGNVEGATFKYQGVTQDLSVHAKGNVARFKVE